MATKKILVTGGAGFIGSFLVDELLKQGHDVRIFDNIEPQVHGKKMPDYINKQAEFIKGDIRNEEQVTAAIEDCEIIFHEAALVGVGQSQYQIKRYVDINTLGTANLLNTLANKEHQVKKLLVASSMSIYGEGAYKNEATGEIVFPELRTEQQMQQKKWELLENNGSNVSLKPIPTPETKPLHANSIYAITKKDQEEMCLNIGKTYGIPTTALRYFNVYGPRQSLSNPYTGVAAIFMSRYKNNNPPLIFEDGLQSRDFISVHDIVQANILAMKAKAADYEVFNVGAGGKVTIKQVAETIRMIQKSAIQPTILNTFRKGDVRHCFADISKIKTKLGFQQKTNFKQGMEELIAWSVTQRAEDNVEKATKELKDKGLI